jgi:hypothetical protein
MKTPGKFCTASIQFVIAATCLCGSASSHAGPQISVMTTIDVVAVNGGADTVNPGTSCIKIAGPVSGACTGGWIAIPNNNKQLLTSALVNKAAGGSVAIYYDDATASNHCPWLAFTPCSLTTIYGK